MKLLKSKYVVLETTFAGTTGGGGGIGSTGTYGAGYGFLIQKITAFCGGTTVAPNSSGGIMFRYGDSSNAILSTMIVLPYPYTGFPTSEAKPPHIGAPLSVTLEGLNIKCNWFEAATNEDAPGGWGISVMGK